MPKPVPKTVVWWCSAGELRQWHSALPDDTGWLQQLGAGSQDEGACRAGLPGLEDGGAPRLVCGHHKRLPPASPGTAAGIGLTQPHELVLLEEQPRAL